MSVANKGLHGDATVDEVQRLVLNLALLTYDLLKLAPPDEQPARSYESEQAAEMYAMLYHLDEASPDAEKDE